MSFFFLLSPCTVTDVHCAYAGAMVRRLRRIMNRPNPSPQSTDGYLVSGDFKVSLAKFVLVWRVCIKVEVPHIRSLNFGPYDHSNSLQRIVNSGLSPAAQFFPLE